jgi:hypothetical protein
MADSAIELTRETGHRVDRWRGYKVVVDGKPVGTIKAGKTHRATVAAGKHTVQLRIDWCSSPTLEVDVPSGGHVALECGPNAKFYNLLWMIIAHAREYIALRPAGAGQGR